MTLELVAPVAPPSLVFTVRGTPVPQGALVRSPNGGLYHRGRGRLEAWRGAIADEARRLMGEEAPSWTDPVSVELTFRLLRPAGHQSRRGGLLPSAPRHPAGRPDVDKLARAALDALTSVVIRDDAQVVRLSATKIYADDGVTGVQVVVEALR